MAEPGVPGLGWGGERGGRGQPGPLPALRRDPTYGDAKGDPPWHTLPAARGGCPVHPVSNGGWKLVSLGKGEFLFFYIIGTLQVNARRKQQRRKKRKKKQRVPGESLGREHRRKRYLFRSAPCEPQLSLVSSAPGWDCPTSTMDETADEPPTSAVLLDNCHFSQVIFNDVEKFYVPGADVTCYYTLTQNIIPRGKDWVGIFRVGWKTTREYYTFMWAPLPDDVHSDTAVQQQIQFKAYYLPKDDEYYQFCYIDQDGVVRGASVPFQFRAETEDDILVVTTQGEVEEIELQNKNLRKENEELKASCASLQKQNMDLQEDLKKTQELQNSLESLRSNTETLELELNSLKKENKRLKELDDGREAEVHQLKEQIQNVTSDKERVETVLKTALDHMDQLQSQVLSYEKEVENLSHIDHDKTEQLESLKEENRQLRMTRTQQQQNRDLMKELEEQKRLFQILQAKKNEADEENQKLRKENDRLLRHLSQTRELSPFSVVSQAQAPIQAPEVGGLLFGNPYCATGTNVGAEAADILSIRKCPMCDEAFPEDIETSQYEAHVQSHLLECPLCSETFEKSNKQVFEDHIFCHGLE